MPVKDARESPTLVVSERPIVTRSSSVGMGLKCSSSHAPTLCALTRRIFSIWDNSNIRISLVNKYMMMILIRLAQLPSTKLKSMPISSSLRSQHVPITNYMSHPMSSSFWPCSYGRSRIPSRSRNTLPSPIYPQRYEYPANFHDRLDLAAVPALTYDHPYVQQRRIKRCMNQKRKRVNGKSRKISERFER